MNKRLWPILALALLAGTVDAKTYRITLNPGDTVTVTAPAVVPAPDPDPDPVDPTPDPEPPQTSPPGRDTGPKAYINRAKRGVDFETLVGQLAIVLLRKDTYWALDFNAARYPSGRVVFELPNPVPGGTSAAIRGAVSDKPGDFTGASTRGVRWRGLTGRQYLNLSAASNRFPITTKLIRVTPD